MVILLDLARSYKNGFFTLVRYPKIHFVPFYGFLFVLISYVPEERSVTKSFGPLVHYRAGKSLISFKILMAIYLQNLVFVLGREKNEHKHKHT